MIALWFAWAHADEPPPSYRVAVRAVAEMWQDAAFGTVYRQGAPLATVSLSGRIVDPLSVEVEAGFRQLTAPDSEDLSLQLVPVAVLAEWSPNGERARPFVGLGPTLTVFSERRAPGADGLGVVSGVRLAAEARFGLRVDTDLIRPAMAPAPSPIRALYGEVFLARRQEMPGGGPGLDVGAWRLAAGLSAGF